MTTLESIIKSRDITLPKKICLVKAMVFPVRTVVLQKTLESPVGSKEIKPVNPKRNQSWICIERTDAEAEAPILWPTDVKNWLTLVGTVKAFLSYANRFVVAGLPKSNCLSISWLQSLSAMIWGQMQFQIFIKISYLCQLIWLFSIFEHLKWKLKCSFTPQIWQPLWSSRG